MTRDDITIYGRSARLVAVAFVRLDGDPQLTEVPLSMVTNSRGVPSIELDFDPVLDRISHLDTQKP